MVNTPPRLRFDELSVRDITPRTFNALKGAGIQYVDEVRGARAAQVFALGFLVAFEAFQIHQRFSTKQRHGTAAPGHGQGGTRGGDTGHSL